MSNPLIEELHEMGAIPSVEITLPTMAYFYPKDEVLRPDANPSQILVGPLSVLEESSLNDPMMMVSGRAITQLLKRIVPMVDNPQQLCELDVQAILIACRIASYGSELKLKHICPHCEFNNSMIIDLSEHIQRFSEYTFSELEQFDIVLPTVEQSVRLKPISYEDAINITMSAIKTGIGADDFDNLEEKELLTTKYIEMYKEQFERALDSNVDALASTIYYATTKSGKIVNDRDLIKTWLTTLPLTDIRAITDRVKTLNEAISERSRLEYECQQCHKETTLMVELNPEKLFTPAEDSETEPNSFAKIKSTKKTTKKQSKASGRLS
jgi:hypothetical protein